jgi:putative transposase
MVRTGVLNDEVWARIEPLLPSTRGRRGGRWRDHRQVIEAVAWRYRTGSPWRDLPAEFGPFQTVWKRHDRWSRDGTWERLVAAVQADADAARDLDWLVSVDSTVVRAHQHAAGARRPRLVEPVEPVQPSQPAGCGAPEQVQDFPVPTGGTLE